ncbi:MAG: hypothetical protein ACXIUO_05860 [Erythrobacter sp.]
MSQHSDETRISTEDVRAGYTGGRARYILGFGLGLAVIAMSVLWIIPALSNLN